MGYYWQFIPKFAQVAQPLHELTLGENAGKREASIKSNNRCQQAFDDLKRLCTPPLSLHISSGLLSSIQMLVGLAWGPSSNRPMRMVWMPS